VVGYRRRSQTGALIDLLPRHDVWIAARIAHLWSRRVVVADEIAADRVGDELVRVRVVHLVVVELHAALNGVADEAEPEAGVADDLRATANVVVLDGSRTRRGNA